MRGLSAKYNLETGVQAGPYSNVWVSSAKETRTGNSSLPIYYWRRWSTSITTGNKKVQPRGRPRMGKCSSKYIVKIIERTSNLRRNFERKGNCST